MTADAEPVKRQFIAGAVCPSCRATDKVRRCEDVAATIWLDCIACGYTQDLTSGYVEAGAATDAGDAGDAVVVVQVPRR